MNFKKRKIRNNLNKIKNYLQQSQQLETYSNSTENTDPTSSHQSDKKSPFLVKYAPIIIGCFLIAGLCWATIALIKSLDFGSVIFSFGKELKSDKNGYTNFLLVGTGGAEHDGGNLTDTIILASLNSQNKTVKMLSIPRDLYIDDKKTGGQRINKLYDTYKIKLKSSELALREVANTLTDMTDLPIHYTVKVDFSGFVKIVDALGGITINVENAIHDPYYPKGETIQYQTFDIKAGLQTLDGDTALKYARSRKTTSDFDRAHRQQLILSAIKEKALDLNLLTDPGKLQALYNSIADSISTDLTVAEILELAKIAKGIDRDKIESRVISDDFTSCGGFLYTPNRAYFGGAAVLLPAGNAFDEVKRFSENYFYSPQLGSNEIQVLNATKTSGLALDYLNRFSRDCLNVVYFGNATNRSQEKSVIYYNRDANGQVPQSNLNQIKDIIDAPVLEGIPAEYLESEKRANTSIVVEIGSDFKKITSSDPFDKLMYTEPTEEEKAAAKAAKEPQAEGISIREEKTSTTTKTVEIPTSTKTSPTTPSSNTP